KFLPLVRAIVARVLGAERSSEWEDACQAIFLRLFEQAASWEGQCPFCKWLAVVAARRAVDFRRRRGFWELAGPEKVPEPNPTPPDRTEEIERVRRKVATFPESWRQVWEMHVEGVNHEEIAGRVGVSRRTVQYWLAEMRERLRPCVEE